MRSTTIILLLLAACYDQDSARRSLENLGRPKPIKCTYFDSRAATFACRDGLGVSWICSDRDGCMQWGGAQ